MTAIEAVSMPKIRLGEGLQSIRPCLRTRIVLETPFAIRCFYIGTLYRVAQAFFNGITRVRPSALLLEVRRLSGRFLGRFALQDVEVMA